MEDVSADDLLLYQRLRLARRHCLKIEKDYERAQRRMTKANRRLSTLLDECEARGLYPYDLRALD